MGRIKTTFVKTIAKNLFEKHEDKFSGDFSKNKQVVNQFLYIQSKKMRNIIAGYVTNLKRQQLRTVPGY